MFRKAERRQAKLRLALCGPSGSGKTYSALLVASGLVPEGKIALLDSERGSGELYADLTAYDAAPLAPPFSPSRYVEGIQQAQQAGYEVLIIDSLSHAWNGEGGILDMHDKVTASQRSGNSFMAWRTVTPQHNQLVDALLGCSMHVIATLRTKTAYDVVEEKGKKKPVKVGLAPIQRDGIEYEFTTVLDLSVDNHVATASKDRTGLFDGTHFVPSHATGEALRDWLAMGSDQGGDSQRLLLDLTDQARSVESVALLTQWWRDHQAEIAQLVSADHQTLTRICGEHKQILLKQESPTAAETPPKRRSTTPVNDRNPLGHPTH